MRDDNAPIDSIDEAPAEDAGAFVAFTPPSEDCGPLMLAVGDEHVRIDRVGGVYVVPEHLAAAAAALGLERA